MSMLRVTLPALLLALPLTACGGEAEVARDEPAPSAEPAPVEPTDDGGFAPSDYSYTLEVTCYCPYATVPVRVTVEDDEVVSAVFEGSGGRGGAKTGDPAPELFELTIDDVIAEAESAEEQGAHRVDVTWPEGSDYPTEVYIDRLENAIDEEIGYRLSMVRVVGEGIGG